MCQVYHIDQHSPHRIADVLRQLAGPGFAGQDVMVKLTMGEKDNKWYVKPPTVRVLTDELRALGARPFIYDTVIVYGGQRNTHEKYVALAKDRGFDSVGCEVVIGDKGRSVTLNEDGIEFKFEVAEDVCRVGTVVSIVHAKGHSLTGFAGTIKNMGMGGVSKSCKLAMHAASVTRKYASFGRSPATFNRILAMGAKACLAGKTVVAFHALIDITKNCDCARNALPIICPDLGYLLSTDPVAIDAATIDLIVRAAGPSVFRKDPWEHVEFAEKIGLGRRSYDLVAV